MTSQVEQPGRLRPGQVYKCVGNGHEVRVALIRPAHHDGRRHHPVRALCHQVTSGSPMELEARVLLSARYRLVEEPAAILGTERE